MIQVSLARTRPDYANLGPPYGPGKAFPELDSLLGDAAAGGPPNHVYAAVRAVLRGLGLDAARFGTRDWNPLGDLVERGRSVVLKPNFIRHWNPCAEGTVESVITHGAILRAVADFAFLAVGPEGSVAVAEAPQHDCDFEVIRRIAGLEELARYYEEVLGAELAVIDLRREAVSYRDGVIVERRALPGDPRGYRLIDLGAHSSFEGSGLDPLRFRGGDYDPGPTTEHHRGGRHAYLLSETVLGADLLVNLPKLKTHKKTGVTLALKNLVGASGDKNLLPHHCAGSPAEGGDEHPGTSPLDRVRSVAAELARRWLARGGATPLVRAARRLEAAARGDAFVRAGNWHGNRTTWRMCVDLNRCFYYSDAAGAHFDAPAPVRRALHVVDGVVAGEGDGPLAPRDRPLGVVLAGLDPLAVDLLAVELMGFDEQRLPKLRESLADPGLRVTAVRSPADVEVVEVTTEEFEARARALVAFRAEAPFLAHAGWRGRVERRAP